MDISLSVDQWLLLHILSNIPSLQKLQQKMKLSESLYDPWFRNCNILSSWLPLPELSFPLAPWNYTTSLTKEIALLLLWNRCENSCLGWRDLWQLQKLSLTNHNENTIILMYLLTKLPSRTGCSIPGTFAKENNLKKKNPELYIFLIMTTWRPWFFFSCVFSPDIPFHFVVFRSEKMSVEVSNANQLPTNF